MADVVWAPWRMTYILAEKSTECIFCERPREQHDAKNLILWRGRTAFVMMNLYPYNNGHLMVVPHAHVASLTELDPSQRAELGELDPPGGRPAVVAAEGIGGAGGRDEQPRAVAVVQDDDRLSGQRRLRHTGLARRRGQRR